MKGRAYTSNSLSRGRAWGVFGESGNSTSGYNYAVFGNLRGSQNGAAVVGVLDNIDLNVPGRYAGYFQGDVRTTGNFYGTVLTPSASRSTLMGRSAVVPLSAESDGENSMSVGEKLSQLTAVQYNLSEPQAVQAFAASGDTVAAAPRSVTDIQALEKTHYGLDAEVLKEVYPDLVYESQEGDLCINYTEMIPLLVQSVNELRAQVVSLQGAQTYNVRARNGSETGVGSNALDVPALEQNDPNPFTQTTVVRYTLPESVKSAFLYIYDLNGTQVDQKTLQSRGKSSVTLEAGNLAPECILCFGGRWQGDRHQTYDHYPIRKEVLMKRWMNLFFFFMGTACTITATTEDGTYFSSVENVSAATFENIPSDCYISVDKHNYRPYVARVQDSEVVYVQNRTFTSTHTVTGENIMVGEKVTTAQPQGKVVVKSGANVTMKASDTTTLEAGFECEKGGVLEIAPL